MKILMVTSTYIPTVGGIENHIKELSSQLRLRGHRVDICVVNTFFKDKETITNGERVFRISAIGKFPFIYFRKLSSYFDIYSYDIIHVHDPHLAGISLHFIMNDYGKPKILSSHGGIFHTKNKIFLKYLYWNTFARLLVKQYSKVICVSPSDYKYYKKITDKAIVIENGIDINKFVCKNTQAVMNKSFIYFGRLSSNKGILNLLEVFKILFKIDKEVKLTLVGEAKDIDIRKKVEKYKVLFPDNLKIYPFLGEKELKEQICKHKFFVTATEYEGFGISILEAVAAGKIAIINNIAPLNKIFSEDEVFFVDFNDINKTVKDILKIMSWPDNRLRQLQLRGIEKVKKYSWESVIPKIEKLYKEVIDV